jgi:putative two-component system response regulator
MLSARVKLHLDITGYNGTLEQLVEERTSEVVELKNTLLTTMANLVEHRDPTTGSHIERTKLYISALMSAAEKHRVYSRELSKLDLELVAQSSQLHDIGKISIPDSILMKSGELTHEEREIMKKHTTFGEDIILKIMECSKRSEFLEYARICAVSHHERWDGGGYPNNLKSKDIPLLGRFMAIADVYDALVTSRPYKRAFSHKRAMGIIVENKGTHFDPALVDLYVCINKEFQMILEKCQKKNSQSS